jgi:hypothetical protein
VSDGEVFTEWANGLQGKSCGSFHTVHEDGFPDSEPVFDVSSGVVFDPLVEVIDIVSEE